jgi:hypothetical protein
VKGKLTSRVSLTKRLMEVNMNNHKDVVSWALEKDGDCSTKSLYTSQVIFRSIEFLYKKTGF